MDHFEMNGRHIVRPEEAADLIGLTPRQLLNLARDGKVESFWVGRQIWYFADSVNAERTARQERAERRKKVAADQRYISRYAGN